MAKIHCLRCGNILFQTNEKSGKGKTECCRCGTGFRYRIEDNTVIISAKRKNLPMNNRLCTMLISS